MQLSLQQFSFVNSACGIPHIRFEKSFNFSHYRLEIKQLAVYKNLATSFKG